MADYDENLCNGNRFTFCSSGFEVLSSSDAFAQCLYQKKDLMVHAEDFIRSEKGKICRKRDGDVLKEFLFTSPHLSNASMSLQECETYCSKQERCWGCSIECLERGECRFNAITNCNKKENWNGLMEGDVTEKPVCLEIKVVTTNEGSLIDWKFGPCSSSLSYADHETYIERCCLREGIHTFSCLNKKKPIGWLDGYIEFQGQRFCDDFMSYKAMRKVEVRKFFTKTIVNPTTTSPESTAGNIDCCKRLTIASTGIGSTYQPEMLGIYRDDGIVNGRVSYRNTRGRYLHFSPDGHWSISDRKNKGTNQGYAFTSCGHECPASCNYDWATYNNENDPWEADPTFNIKCGDGTEGFLGSKEGCPFGTIKCDGVGCPNTCYCEDHCSWEKCLLEVPPEECLLGTKGAWIWNTNKMHWTAELADNDSTIQIITSTSTADPAAAQITRKESEKNALKKIKDIQDGGHTTTNLLFATWGILTFLFFFHSPQRVRNNPKLLTERARLIFTLSCISMGAYMTITQSTGFLENRDSSSITYKHFNQDLRDRYPTFSICLKGPEIFWKNEDAVFEHFGMTSSQYMRMLKGDGMRYELNETTRLYRKQTIDFGNVSMLDFEKVSIKSSDVITATEFVTESQSHNTHYERDTNFKDVPFHIGYRTHNEICFTRNSTDQLNSVRAYDLVSLERSLLSPGSHFTTILRTIVHYPGHLLRNFDNPSYSSTFDEYQADTLLQLKISHVTTLRKRPKSNVRCDDTIQNDDMKFQLEVSRRIGCIPVYWLHSMTTQKDMTKCESEDEFRMADYYIRNYKDVLASYDPPCVDMTTLVIVDRNLGQTDEQFRINVMYAEDFYQEIENGQDISFETFFSGVGGFVGIFCGFSILQAPDFFFGIWDFLRKKKIKGMFGTVCNQLFQFYRNKFSL